MSKKIIIAGAGHAAMMCGATLAKNGYDVTVYERRKRKDVGYPWFDCVNPDIFEMVGAPTPEEAGIEWAWRNDITFYGPNTDDDHKIFQHLNFPEDTEIIIDRFKLYDLMIDYAEKCGVKFEYGVNIKGPIVKKNRIVGINTSKGKKMGDLIIDGCGCNSVLRNNLPDYWGIQKNPPRGDIIYLYRAYFDCPVDPDTVEDKYKCIFLPSDTDFNFCWTDVVKDFDGFDKFTDVLIADIDPMSPEEAERRAEDYRKRIPELGKTRLKGGQVTPLTIREPLSNLVADGYVAIGDSAHMSMAVNGSGLSIGFEVSQFLAETIMADKKGEFTAKTLYPFAYKFWKKKGINMAPIAFVKLLIFKLTHEQLDYAFDKGILTWREMTITADQHSIFQFLHWDWGLPKRGVALFTNPGLLKIAAGALIDALGIFALGARLPKKYNRRKVIKWAKRYDWLFQHRLPKA